MNSLYTFIIDYKGGTYIEQIEAENANTALVNWISTPHILNIPGLGVAAQQALLLKITDINNQPMPLENTKNVWCTAFTTRGAMMLIHIVCTA